MIYHMIITVLISCAILTTMAYVTFKFIVLGADVGGFSFWVSDGTNSNPKRETFSILAQPLTLRMVKNSRLKVYPGKGYTITADNLLAKTNDQNQTKPIIFHIQTKPQKGKIVTMYKDRALEVTSFKQEDINDGKILYQHESYTKEWTDTDRFMFEVQTLYAQPIKNQIFNIEISYGNFLGRSQSDVVHLEGFVVKEGDRHTLTKRNIDVSNYTQQLENTGKRANVWYSLVTRPIHGNLLRSGRVMDIGGRFTQNDINGGQIKYRHDNSDTTNDSFVFTVHIEIQQMNKNPDNQETRVTFNISVLPVNDQPFTVISSNPVIEVVEGMSAVLSDSVLNTIDEDTPPGGITYTVKTAPSNGILGFENNPMQQVRSFTQKDVNDQRVAFSHYGSKASGRFEVLVSDGKFPSVRKVVSVIIIPIAIQVTNNRTIYIQQADTSVYITKDNLDISTNGNREKIHYQIKTGPRFGQIRQLVYPVNYFKQVDIDSRNLLYIQRNLSSHRDSFVCDINYEGTHTSLANRRVVIMVKPLVKQSPIRAFPGRQTPITTANLDASQLANITGHDPSYRIVDRPKFGYIVKTVRSKREGNGRSRYRQIESFTHEDVIYVKIYYVSRDIPYQMGAEDSFTYMLSSKGVQPALGRMSLKIESYAGYTTPTFRNNPFDWPKNTDNSTVYSKEPNKGEIVSPSVSPDFVIILAILVPLFVLVILVIIIVFILWRKQRYRDYSPPGGRGRQSKTRFRPEISGPVPLQQPHVHIQLQDCAARADDNDSLVYEHHNYYNVPVAKGAVGFYANQDIGQGHSDADDLDTQSDNESDVVTPLVDDNMAEFSATVPECKVTPIAGGRDHSPERSSRCSLDLFDWSMIEDPEFLQHCRTSAPVLRDNQYWL